MTEQLYGTLDTVFTYSTHYLDHDTSSAAKHSLMSYISATLYCTFMYVFACPQVTLGYSDNGISVRPVMCRDHQMSVPEVFLFVHVCECACSKK